MKYKYLDLAKEVFAHFEWDLYAPPIEAMELDSGDSCRTHAAAMASDTRRQNVIKFAEKRDDVRRAVRDGGDVKEAMRALLFHEFAYETWDGPNSNMPREMYTRWWH